MASAEPGPADQNETRALRAALDQSLQKRAALAAQVEELQRAPVIPSAQDGARLEALQASYEATLERAEAAEARVKEAQADAERSAGEAAAAKRYAASKEPIDPASVPDRIRALELELEMARAARPPEPPPKIDADPLADAFTPKEEEDARLIRELQATVAELEAERDARDGMNAVEPPAQGDAPLDEPTDPLEPPASDPTTGLDQPPG